MAHIHDTSFKLLFSMPDFVRDLITGFIPDAWLHALDFSTLERYPVNFITEKLNRRDTDIVWRLRVNGEWAYLYLLIDHQSRVDHYMSLRMMVYVGLLYQDLQRGSQLLANGSLPPVLPIVLYNGQTRWKAATNIADLIPALPGELGQYQPQFRYVLVDENAYADDELSLKNLVAAVFRLDRPKNPEDIKAFMQYLNLWLDDRPEIRLTIAQWLRSTLMQDDEYRIVLPEIQKFEEMRAMLSEKIREWAKDAEAQGMRRGIRRGLKQGIERGIQRGIEKGMEQGLQKGERCGELRALERLLAKRFGPIPPAIHERMATAKADELDIWLLRVLDAGSLEDVFP